MKKKVLLVSMPFGALERPALGISLLKARLARDEIACETRYLNFDFADFIGFDEYQWLSFELPYTAFAGDWTFTEALYGPRPEVDASYVENILLRTWRVDDAAVTRLQFIRSFVDRYLDHCMVAVRWEDY